MTDKRYDVWIASSLLNSKEVDVEIRFISLKTGRDVCQKEVHRGVMAEPNGTTVILEAAEVPVHVPEIAHEPIDEHNKSTWVKNQAGPFKYPSRHRKDVKPFDLASYDSFVVHATLYEVDSKGTTFISEDSAWPQPYKYLDFSDRGVEVRFQASKQEVVVSSSKPVKGFVFDEKREWTTFSDNGFDIMPGEEKVIKLSGKKIDKGEELSWRWLGMEDDLGHLSTISSLPGHQLDSLHLQQEMRTPKSTPKL